MASVKLIILHVVWKREFACTDSTTSGQIEVWLSKYMTVSLDGHFQIQFTFIYVVIQDMQDVINNVIDILLTHYIC